MITSDSTLETNYVTRSIAIKNCIHNLECSENALENIRKTIIHKWHAD